MNEILFIMGNGPSLKNIMDNKEQLDFVRLHHSFGLNMAYRLYPAYDFTPTYYGSFDRRTIGAFRSDFEKYLTASTVNKCFFIEPQSFSKSFTTNDKFQPINLRMYHPTNVHTFDSFYDLGSSGANAAQVGILLGYKTIVLLGCDCDYTTNGAHWNDKYHLDGESHNAPNLDTYHFPAWKRLATRKPEDVQILNASPISKISHFPFVPMHQIMDSATML